MYMIRSRISSRVKQLFKNNPERVIILTNDGILQLILSELRDLKQGQVKLEQRFDVLEQRFDVLEQRFDTLEQRVDKLQQDVTSMKKDIVSLKREVGDITVAVVDISRKLDVVGDKTAVHERKFTALKAL